MTLPKLFALSLGFLGLHAPSDFAVSDHDGDTEPVQDSLALPGLNGSQGLDPSSSNQIRAPLSPGLCVSKDGALVNLTTNNLAPVNPSLEIDVIEGGNVFIDNNLTPAVIVEVWDRIGPTLLGAGYLAGDDGLEGGPDEYNAPHGLSEGVYDIRAYWATNPPSTAQDIGDIDVEGP